MHEVERCKISVKIGRVVSEQKWLRLEPDSAAAQVLTDARALRYFAPFMRGPVTLTEAARVAGTSPQAMKYWLKKFLDAGLVKTVPSERPRGTTRYAATAPAYLVPFDATRFALMREWVENRLKPYHERLVDLLATSFESQGLNHVLIHLDPVSGEILQTSADENGPVERDRLFQDLLLTHGFAGEVVICREEVDNLVRDLTQLWKKYASRADGCRRKQRVFVYAFLVRSGP